MLLTMQVVITLGYLSILVPANADTVQLAFCVNVMKPLLTCQIVAFQFTRVVIDNFSVNAYFAMDSEVGDKYSRERASEVISS